MKNEEFDDAIRRKLEGIEPTFTGADIEKVLRYAARGRPSPLRWLKGNWYFLALSAAAMVGVTTWIIVSSREGFNSGIPEKPIASVEIQAQQNDTFHASTKTSLLPVITSTSEGSASSANVISSARNPDDHHSFRKTPGLKHGAITEKPSETEEKSFERAPELPANVAVTESSAITGIPIINTAAEKIIAPETKLTDSTLFIESKPVPEKNMPANLPLLSEDTTIREPGEAVGRDRLLFTGIRLKTGMPVSNQSFGAGFGVELLAGQHAGISFGLRYSHTYTETFFTEDILRGHRHDRMGPDFHRRFDGQDVFIDISVSNSIIQMPFSLSYYIPFNHGYKMNFTIGSDLDLSVKQSVNFTHLFDSAGMKRVHIDAGGSVSPINTMYLAAGIEKEWGRVLLQLSPFISPHLRQVYYKPKQIEYGLDVSLKYRLWNNPGNSRVP